MQVTYDYREIEIEHEGKQYRVLFENVNNVIDVQVNTGDPGWFDYEDVPKGDLYNELIKCAMPHIPIPVSLTRSEKCD